MTAAIDISGLSKRFGRTAALDQVSFEVPRGGVFGLLGPNGAGKTTLFSIVAGFLKPTSGRVEVLGIDVENVSQLRGRLSILPQDAQFQGNVPVLEQVIFFSQLSGRTRAEAEKQAADALALVGLSEKAKSSARTLSHGMAKRLGIAQAFMGDPEVILLDEPTAGLDPAAAAGIRELVERLRTTATLVISSHDLGEIQKMCEHVAILDHGKLVECNSVAAITQADALLRLTFARPLTDAEIETIRGVAGVAAVDAADGNRYSITLAPEAAADQDAVVSDIVSQLVVTGAVPRAIEHGEALESRFLHLTKPAS